MVGPPDVTEHSWLNEFNATRERVYSNNSFILHKRACGTAIFDELLKAVWIDTCCLNSLFYPALYCTVP